MYDLRDDQISQVEDSFVAYLSSDVQMRSTLDGALSNFSISQFFGDRY